VFGVDHTEIPGVGDRTDAFLTADLNAGIPKEVGAGYDVVIAGDVIEHLSTPADALREIVRVLRPGGQVLLSVPNFGHWYPRLRIVLGAFGYDRRGILDETHLRFFTRSALRRLVRRAGFDILQETATGLPFASVASGGSISKALQRVDAVLVRVRPTLFGYQYLMRLTPHGEETVHSDPFLMLTEADSAPALSAEG
jgi:SAM-dependent methyltransferase